MTMKRLAAAFTNAFLVLAPFLTGCSEENSNSQAPTPTAYRASRDFQDPLTEREISRFLTVVRSLPDGCLPEFEPLDQGTARKGTSASHLADIFRQEYRAMFDAARHGQRWRRQETLVAVFDHHGTTPEDFASLMIRLSCAVAASTLSSDVDLAVVTERADRQVASLIRRIDNLDSVAQSPSRFELRGQLLDSLQQYVAFSEFARLLSEVPKESLAVVSRYHAQIAAYLPRSGSIEGFERTIESSVVPTSFVTP